MHIDTQYHKCNYNVHTVYKAKTTSPTTTTTTTTCTKRKLQLHYGMAWYHFRIAVQAIDSFSSIIRPSLSPNYEHIYTHTHTEIYCCYNHFDCYTVSAGKKKSSWIKKTVTMLLNDFFSLCVTCTFSCTHTFTKYMYFFTFYANFWMLIIMNIYIFRCLRYRISHMVI